MPFIVRPVWLKLQSVLLAKGLEAAGVRALQRGEPESLRTLAPRMSELLLDAFGYKRRD